MTADRFFRHSETPYPASLPDSPQPRHDSPTSGSGAVNNDFEALAATLFLVGGFFVAVWLVGMIVVGVR